MYKGSFEFSEPNQPYDYWRPTEQRNQYRANPTVRKLSITDVI